MDPHHRHCAGYLLPWNELAYFATKVGTEDHRRSAGDGSIPRPPVERRRTDVTGATLTRFYGIHVAILPATATRSWASTSTSSRKPRE